jgi:hypothetical protein
LARIGCIKPSQPDNRKLLKQKLRLLVNEESYNSFSSFFGEDLTFNSLTEKEELNKTIKDKLMQAYPVRQENTVIVEVPKRKMDPDL